MEIKMVPLKALKTYEKNPRRNDNAVEPVANSIREFGFKMPMIIDSNNVIVCGHTRYKAAVLLKLDKVPCVIADDLTPEQIKALRLADNKLAGLAGWDWDMLSEEMSGISDIDMSMFSFDAIPTSDEINSFFEAIPHTSDPADAAAPPQASSSDSGSVENSNDDAPPVQAERVSPVGESTSYLRITCPHCGEVITLNNSEAR